jgi:hypothetical protein
MELTLLRRPLAVCRLDPESEIPEWARKGPFFSITRTPEEVSIVCDDAHVPAQIPAERDWRAYRLKGPIPFTAIGVLSALVAPLARSGISVFAISTFDTDYLLVRHADVKKATLALREDAHQVHLEPRS